MELQQSKSNRVPKAIRVKDDVWEAWGKIAETVGLTRSAFIKLATAEAAELVLAGGVPYFVGGPEATTQNTRTNNSDPLSLTQGGGNDSASDRRRRRSVAKGADEASAKKRSPQG